MRKFKNWTLMLISPAFLVPLIGECFASDWPVEVTAEFLPWAGDFFKPDVRFSLSGSEKVRKTIKEKERKMVVLTLDKEFEGFGDKTNKNTIYFEITRQETGEKQVQVCGNRQGIPLTTKNGKKLKTVELDFSPTSSGFGGPP